MTKKKTSSIDESRREKSILEKLVDGMGEELDLDVDEAIRLEEGKKQFKKEFEERLEAYELQAKNLLDAVAKAYLGSEFMSKHEYAKYKLEVDKMGLKSLLFQLDVSRMAIYKLSEEIEIGTPHPRHYEVLTGLQRVVLDITKFQQQFLDAIQKSLINIKQEIKEANKESGESGGDGGPLLIKEGEGKIFSTSDRAMLIRELKGLGGLEVDEKGNFSVSRNKNLRTEAENREYVEVVEEEESNEHVEGLESFDDFDSEE